jgi:hypothetical protein
MVPRKQTSAKPRVAIPKQVQGKYYQNQSPEKLSQPKLNQQFSSIEFFVFLKLFIFQLFKLSFNFFHITSIRFINLKTHMFADTRARVLLGERGFVIIS